MNSKVAWTTEQADGSLSLRSYRPETNIVIIFALGRLIWMVLPFMQKPPRAEQPYTKDRSFNLHVLPRAQVQRYHRRKQHCRPSFNTHWIAQKKEIAEVSFAYNRQDAMDLKMTQDFSESQQRLGILKKLREPQREYQLALVG